MRITVYLLEESMDLVDICKRENNSKRNYLVLNRLQCKHYPSSPLDALELFKSLAYVVKPTVSGDRVLCVGFAETATAIGLEVAITLGYDYINTTREQLNCKTFDFSEEHSHATEQRLAYVDLSRYDRVLFVEDEVTTGKTILNIVNILRRVFPKLKYSVASILNGMSKEQLEQYSQEGISVNYLRKIDNSMYSAIAERVNVSGLKSEYYNSRGVTYRSFTPSMYKGINTRNIVDVTEYSVQMDDLCNYIFDNVCRDILSKDTRICVIGTEEFMYPAIRVGENLEKEGYKVVSHSTTRSPIEVSSDRGYPLTSRCQLPSVYDANRVTYIYNLDVYDKVIIVTENNTNVNSLVKALKDKGNEDICVVKIGE